RNVELDLAAENHRVYGPRRTIGDPQLKNDMRRCSESKSLCRFNREVQIRIHHTNSSRLASPFQTIEELSDFLPDDHASRQPFPLHANNSDELETFINWNDVVFPGRADAVYEQTFDVGLHRGNFGIVAFDIHPR